MEQIPLVEAAVVEGHQLHAPLVADPRVATQGVVLQDLHIIHVVVVRVCEGYTRLLFKFSHGILHFSHSKVETGVNGSEGDLLSVGKQRVQCVEDFPIWPGQVRLQENARSQAEDYCNGIDFSLEPLLRSYYLEQIGQGGSKKSGE